jgi:hypothetical protein
MIDESLLKSNFIGRDGFRWWIGQIPPIESMGKQPNCEGGWGNRSKVRILGYHPYDVDELPNEELPWAQVLLSPSDGSGAANCGTNPKLRPGDIVFGFFLDGDNAQIPVISGCFGRTNQVPSVGYTSPFVPFTGYTSRIPNDGSKLQRNEENEQTPEAQKSPYHLPPSVANRINQISYFSGIGDTVVLATNKPGSKIDKIQTELENAIKFLENIKSYPNVAQVWIDEQIDKLCDEISKKIVSITNDIVSGIVNDIYEKLIPALNQGAKTLYNQVSSTVTAATGSKSTGHLAGAKAQEVTIKPVEELQKLIPCLISNIIKSLASLIGDMVCALLKNVANIVKCVIDQFIGGLLNSIINLITSGIRAVLGGLSLLLSFSNFNLGDAIRQTAEGLLGIPFSLNCGEESEEEGVEKWTIGSGPEQSSSFNINDILSLANTANAIASDPASTLSGLAGITGPLDFLNANIRNPDFEGILGKCYGGPPINFLPPTINIFGGSGSGASAVPIFGSIVGNTASIIGAVVTSGGSGYTYPPFVSITDNRGRGYGAAAKSVIQNGEVIAIIFNSEGEGYTRGENLDVSISSVFIENPGFNYQKGDTAVDNFGNVYDLVIGTSSDDDTANLTGATFATLDGTGETPATVGADDFTTPIDSTGTFGSIVSVTLPPNIKEITDLPVIRVISKTGAGAKLKPVFRLREEIEKERNKSGLRSKVENVIDCVS